MNTESSKTNEANKFIYQFTDKLNLKTPNIKNIGLVNLSIYYTWKNIKSEYNNNKFEMSVPTWNDELDLSVRLYSVSDIQDYFEFIIKKYETVAQNLPIQIYPNKIKNRIVFKVKTGCKLELLSPKTMKLLGSTKKMLIEIQMEKMYQKQNLLKLFWCIVAQSITVISKHQKYYLLLYLIKNFVS